MVTIRYQDTDIDFELPTTLPLGEVVASIYEHCDFFSNIPKFDPNLFLGHAIIAGRIIQPNQTLSQSEVCHGDILDIVVENAPSNEDNLSENSSTTGQSYILSTDPNLRCLETGRVFPCKYDNNLIGRSRDCTINLGDIPRGNRVSRIHANILRRNQVFHIQDEDSKHGTLVDGYKLKRGERIILNNGSRIKFGENGPTLEFLRSET